MKPKTPQVPKLGKSNKFIIVIVGLLLLAGLFTILSPLAGDDKAESVSITKIVSLFDEQKLVTVSVDDLTIVAEDTEGNKYKATRSSTDSIAELGFYKTGNPANVTIEDNRMNKLIAGIFSSLIPFAFILIVLVFILKQAQGNANSAFSFGQSKAKLNDKEKNKTTFKDVAGAAEAKEDLGDVVDFLKNPKKYSKMGAKIPKGVLLYGPPGTGKTLLARAVAGEANVPFYTISGSEFVEMFVGVGASRVRDLFKKAKRSAPSIIFIDEIDAVGRQRGTGMGGGHDEREQTLNQILTEMDGFEVDTSVIIMASTNRPDVLDPALLRPGRFDRRVVIDRPNMQEREEILVAHSKNKPIEKGVDVTSIAKKIPGFTGADIENLLNESAILAVKRNRKDISLAEMNESIEKVSLGPQRKSSRLNSYEKKLTAYHELGHALVGHMLPHCDPVHKVSIISRGMALGVTWFLPTEDVKLQSKQKFLDDISSLLGGRVAEEVFYGADNITTGASNDLERASEVARNMVTHFGMTSALGHMVVETRKNVFLGRDLGESKVYGNETAQVIDQEVRTILDKAYAITKEIILKHKDLMDKMCADLLIKEEFSEEDFAQYFVSAKVKIPVKIGVERAKD